LKAGRAQLTLKVMKNTLRSCWLLGLCVSACTGTLAGQSARKPTSQEDCHPLALDRRGFRQSPRDVLEAFPKQADVPMYWLDASIEDYTERFEQADVRAETRMAFTLEYDATREIWECVGRTQTCRSGKCTTSEPNSGYITVPVTATLTTEDGVDATFEMELFGDAPNEPYPINVPTLQWPHPRDEPYAAPALSSEADWASPGFGEFAMSFVGYTFMGRFHDSERGLALWPTPCGGQQQVSPSDLVFGQQESAASVFEALGSRQLTNADDSNMPDITLTISMEDTTACYDIRGGYHLDVRVKVETDGAVFESLTHVTGNFAEGDDVLAAFEDVCGEIAISPAWSGLFDSNGGSGEGICVSAAVRRTEAGVAVAAEVSTREATSAGHRLGWSYRELSEP
jgi:hypothetical protein